MPQQQGLYDPRHEKDSCGVGMIADLEARAQCRGRGKRCRSSGQCVCGLLGVYAQRHLFGNTGCLCSTGVICILGPTRTGGLKPCPEQSLSLFCLSDRSLYIYWKITQSTDPDPQALLAHSPAALGSLSRTAARPRGNGTDRRQALSCHFGAPLAEGRRRRARRHPQQNGDVTASVIRLLCRASGGLLTASGWPQMTWMVGC